MFYILLVFILYLFFAWIKKNCVNNIITQDIFTSGTKSIGERGSKADISFGMERIKVDVLLEDSSKEIEPNFLVFEQCPNRR